MSTIVGYPTAAAARTAAQADDVIFTVNGETTVILDVDFASLGDGVYCVGGPAVVVTFLTETYYIAPAPAPDGDGERHLAAGMVLDEDQWHAFKAYIDIID